MRNPIPCKCFCKYSLFWSCCYGCSDCDDVNCGNSISGEARMPFTRRPLQTTVTFVALNGLLCLSVGPVYDFVCDLPYWERRRERLRQERELLGAGVSQGVLSPENSQG